jgi:hypothetical protein
MIHPVRYLPLSMLAFTCSAACAEPAQAGGQTSGPELWAEAWGIVTNQAVTVAGHEFCKYFLADWRDKPGSDRYTLASQQNQVAVTQDGTANSASVVQGGLENLASIQQYGVLNTARIEQYGQGTARITQYGNSKSASIIQY